MKNDLSTNSIDESTFENSFKYFALNGNTILAIKETSQEMPNILILCRSLFGKTSWTLNFRQLSLILPKTKVGTSKMFDFI